MVSHSAKDTQCRPNCWITHGILATEVLLLANFCLLWQKQPSSGGWWSVTPSLSSLRIGASPAWLGHFLTAWGHFPSQPFLTLLKIHLFSCFSCRPLSVTLHAPTLTCFQAVDQGCLKPAIQGQIPAGFSIPQVNSAFTWGLTSGESTFCVVGHKTRVESGPGGLVYGSPVVDRATTALAYATLVFLHPRIAFSKQTVTSHNFLGDTQTHPFPRLSRFSSAQVHSGMQITLWIHRPIDEGSILKKTCPSWTLRGLN